MHSIFTLVHFRFYTNFVCPSVDRDVAERSILIKNMLEDLGESDEAIPIPNVSLICTLFLLVSVFYSNSILLHRSTRWC